MAERHRLESGAPGGAGAAGLAAPLGELHLFVHDYNSAQMLQHLSSLAQLVRVFALIVYAKRGCDDCSASSLHFAGPM